MLFDELSENWLARSGMSFLRGVPIPLRAADLVAFEREGSLDLTHLADNMALVLGVNPKIAHAGAYMRSLRTAFSEKLVDVLTSKGSNFLVNEQYRSACAYFRAALMLDDGDQKAMFGYACCCREWYLSLEGEDDADDLIRTLKAESTEYLEKTTDAYPLFGAAWYFLGYAYLNEGLYTKASFVWKRFLELADPKGEEAEEIRGRVESLKEPVRIEAGINHLLAGRLEQGLRILEPYVDSEYKDWWPLHFYLASAYRALGHPEEAVEGFTKVLSLSPSHADSMQALSELYRELGNEAMAEKYAKKYELVTGSQPEA